MRILNRLVVTIIYYLKYSRYSKHISLALFGATIIVIIWFIACYVISELAQESMPPKIHVTEKWSNLAILFAGPIALAFAAFRSWIARNQQLTDARGRLDDRFQRGASMLEVKEVAVRKAGIIILERLSKDHTHEFHIQVVDLLALFVRHNCEEINSKESSRKKSSTTKSSSTRYLKVDQTATIDALRVIINRDKFEVLTYVNNKGGSDKPLIDLVLLNSSKSSNFSLPNLDKPNFQYVNFSNSVFFDIKLTQSRFDHGALSFVKFLDSELCSASFRGACLDDADFSGTDLTDADFSGASLKNAHFDDANLKRANLKYADLSGADFSNSKNLMEDQLTESCQSEEGMPPKLGKLEWKQPEAMNRFRRGRWRIIRWLTL